MISRKIAVLAALSMLVATTPSMSAPSDSQTPTKGQDLRTDQDQGSDLWVILGAIAAAALVTLLATKVGGNDKPASP